MLRVTYEISDSLSEDAPIRITEGRGWVNYELHGGIFIPEGVAALNSAAETFLAGGQWFQLWRGDVVSMQSPETEGRDGWLHRGPLAYQTAGPANG